MSKLTKDALKASIERMPGDSFTFEDLRNRVSADYEVLKDLVFELLDEQQPIIRQVFDSRSEAIRLERSVV